ncbi:MAG TPA: DUF3311 domain-containing protein [Mycobacteriales bacterium]|jgi:hypothetical protein|nr:DUF3311 domain-containing protein [Mycobacteriales bacterium]
MSRLRGAAGNGAQRRWYLLLALPFLGLLWPPLYARAEPRLFGVPFFYWYQFAWIALSVLITWLVVRATDDLPEGADQP